MYAVIKVAGKQHRVEKGRWFLVDQPEDQDVNAEVLLVADGATVKTGSDAAKAKVKLSKWDPNDKGDVEGGKSAGLERLRELSDAQKQGLSYGEKVPFVFANVLLADGVAFSQLGLTITQCPFDAFALHPFFSKLSVKLSTSTFIFSTISFSAK